MAPQPKRKREERPEADVADKPAKSNAIVPTMPWTEFNSCLELVFDYLALTDLTNAADAHPDFAPAAQSKYQRKYRQMEVVVSSAGHTVGMKSGEWLKGWPEVTLASFMKHFGHLVLKLTFDYCRFFDDNNDAHHWREAERIIFEYCTESLTELKLLSCRGNVFEEIRKPFEKVTRVIICSNEKTLELDEWFPNAFRFEPSKSTPHSPSVDGQSVSSAVKLTDLNEYCLEAIFTHLDATALTNMADADEHFVSTAQLIYRRKYSEKQLVISEFGHKLNFGWMEELNVTLASLVKHFGHLMLSLKIDYDCNVDESNAHHWRLAEQHIYNHCVDTLKFIEVSRTSIECIDAKIMEENRKPFNNVEELRIVNYHDCGDTDCDLFLYGFELNDRFPRVRRLKLEGQLRFLTFMTAPLGHLTELALLIWQDSPWDCKAQRNFLKQNSHIEKLSIGGDKFSWNKELLLFLSQTFKNLQVLDVDVDLDRSFITSSIHFKSVTSFTMRFQHWFADQQVIPLTFDKLKTLEIETHEYYLNGEMWINFISQNRGLVDVKVIASEMNTEEWISQYSATELFQMVSSLPELETFYLPARIVVAEEHGVFLQKCKSLHKLTNVRLQ